MQTVNTKQTFDDQWKDTHYTHTHRKRLAETGYRYSAWSLSVSVWVSTLPVCFCHFLLRHLISCHLLHFVVVEQNSTNTNLVFLDWISWTTGNPRVVNKMRLSNVDGRLVHLSGYLKPRDSGVTQGRSHAYLRHVCLFLNLLGMWNKIR